MSDPRVRLVSTTKGKHMFPYLPVQPAEGKALAFQHISTGEILEFDASWLTHLDGVERILMQNHYGDYEVILP
jgi:hypothetical protein